MREMWLEVRGRWGRATRDEEGKNTQRSGDANGIEGSEMTEERLKKNRRWTRPLKGLHESGNGGGVGQASKARRERGGTSEGASNDAVVASLGRSVGGYARVGARESDSPKQNRKHVLVRNGSTKNYG